MLKYPKRTTRRTAIRLFASIAGAAAIWRPDLATATTPTGTIAPAPSYVPTPFRFRRRFDRLTDGFGGATDVTYAYVNRDAALANAFPLLVCGSYDPHRELGGTVPNPGEAITLVAPDGTTMYATYHDGIWWLQEDGTVVWNNSNVHSLSFAKDGVTYGIRGARSVGITFAELQKIALSLT